MDALPEGERYTVFLNPYPEHRFADCPRCGEETHERNRVLVLQLGREIVLPAMAACRFCASCDLLIAHQDELKALLQQVLPQEEQRALEEPMIIMGTVDRGRLRGGEIDEFTTPAELLDAFRPVRQQVDFELVEDEAGDIEIVETTIRTAAMPADVPVPELTDILDLPQAEETWQVGAICMPTWVADEDEELFRPYLILVVSTDGPTILFQEMLTVEPTELQIRDALLKAMSYPAMGAGPARRPTTIVVEEEHLAEVLAVELAALDIRCITGPVPELDDVRAMLESFLEDEGDTVPGLLDDPRVTPERVGEFFKAAAEFYREAPWELMLDEDIVALRYPLPDGEWRFGSVMGNAGLEFGLAVFEDLLDFDRLAMTAPEDLIGAMRYRSLTYDDMSIVPFADLDAAERYGWEIAADEAYPIPLIFTEDEELLRPGPEEIEWYTAVLQAVTTFYQEFWPEEEGYVPEPLSATITVPLAGRSVDVELRYPADLAFEVE